MSRRNYIAVRRGNGAPLAIAEVTRDSVTVQGWVHRETFTRAAFAEVFKVKRIRTEVSDER
jgi:hypothetical protein